MSNKKEEQKSLIQRIIDREEVDLREFTMKEIEEVIRELVEYRIDRIRTEEAIRLLDAVTVAITKIRSVLQKEER